MADRLSELLRQRALLQEHLAWLDREIAAASDRPAAPQLPAPAIQPAAPVPLPAAASLPARVAVPSPAASIAASAEVAPLADEILDQYRVPTQTLQTDVRKGCLLYFVGAFVLLFGIVAILYVAFRK